MLHTLILKVYSCKLEEGDDIKKTNKLFIYIRKRNKGITVINKDVTNLYPEFFGLAEI